MPSCSSNDSERANQLDVPLFYETLLTNDKTVLTGNHFLDYVNLSNSELNLERGKLLEKKRIIY
ncbi:hypothetical protein PAJ34TS1_31660 [Paenibacillus azoreducens]|uniref:Uncharacterized protein n=1 Tax=Paenibacillus azoreducens TaxID=116718 RepID=A0A919Y8I0_9BACL|nr:hypothetical protein J34TS1_17060 [Paenibacillus azoreducens]